MATAPRNLRHTPFGPHRADIFPILGIVTGAGMITGVVVSTIIYKLTDYEAPDLLVQTILSAGLGGIFGLFLGLSRTISDRGRILCLPLAQSAPDQLWDSWIDSGCESEQRSPQAAATAIALTGSSEPHAPATPLPRRQLCVRPRVISPVTGETIPLDDEIGQIVQEGRHKRIALIGGPGSGKTTALRHLATVLPSWLLSQLRLIDDPRDDADVASLDLAENDPHVVICAATQPPPGRQRVNYSLASWNQDDLIEYLLSAHWDRCASVMSRLKRAREQGFLKGIPELWAIALDQMAFDEAIVDVRTAIRRELAQSFDEYPDAKILAQDFCLTALSKDANPTFNLSLSVLSGDNSTRTRCAARLLRLIRHRPVALLLAADRIRDILESGRVNPVFGQRFPHDLIEETALVIAGNDLALQHLGQWLYRSEDREIQPMAASLLHASVPGWRPGSDCSPELRGAYLARAAWPGLNLSGVNLESADFSGANLSGVNLEQSRASRALFSRANIEEAVLNSCVAISADFTGANLRSVRAVGADFYQSSLAGACLVHANLRVANLQGANIEGADLTGANLEDARLRGLNLRLARFEGARFGDAELRDCDMEGMALTVPDFHDADLRNALLTGSRMLEANFAGANLRGAGLAEIDWPGADLHGADLRGASFHLGSSRNGLVGSLIACEGSRTGFYTDDYHDQHIKSPEEIRKANLRGADLRGAHIKDVDFYLVDLREAKYTRHQAEHFHRCRAILD